MRELPLPSQVQNWINGVIPEPFLEQFVTSPGLLVLRVKSPQCQYQGLHLVMTRPKAAELAMGLSELETGQSLLLKASFPTGSVWFEMFTSAVRFGVWTSIEFENSCHNNGEVEVEFCSGSIVRLSMSKKELKVLISLIKAEEKLPQPIPLGLTRTQRPSSSPHHLWLWNWGYKD